MKPTIVLVSIIFCLSLLGGWLFWGRSSDSSTMFAKDEINRSAQFHSLSGVIKVDQAKLNDFISGWMKICSIKSMELKMDQTGDPACQPKPPAAAAPAK